MAEQSPPQPGSKKTSLRSGIPSHRISFSGDKKSGLLSMLCVSDS